MPPLPDEVVLDLVDELRRLANGLTRDVRRQAILPGLSNLAAMRPVQELLTRHLSMLLTDPPTDDGGGMDDGPTPGYL